MESSKFKCNYCFKEYTRKSFYKKHVACCEIINNSKKENRLLREEDDLPSQDQVFQVVKELVFNYEKLKKEMEEIKRHVYKTKRKMYLVDWLNNNKKINKNITNYINDIEINVSDIVNNNMEKIYKLLFTEKENIPIYCFDQKKNIIFIFDEEWKICSDEKFIEIIDLLNSRILRMITNYNLESTNEYCNLIKEIINNNDYKLIRKNVFQAIKTNITNIVEYEFV